MSQEILLLKLLHIPVIVITFISRIISILTYLPNYIIIYLLDYVIFHPQLQSTLIRYIISWPIRFIAINMVIALFIWQFTLMYNLLHLSQHQWYVQFIAITFGYGGMVVLMRKGYLQMIKKFNPTKLKSVMEHLLSYVQFCIDILAILLAVVNVVLLTNAHKTLSYTYYSQQQLQQLQQQQKRKNKKPTTNNPFLSHITTLIHKSLIYNLTFFYIKIFFRLFPWRYQNSLQYVEKQKNNLFHLLVLLTVLFVQTMVDVVVVGLLGPVCVVHWKRGVFKHRLRTQERKYRVVLEHFGLIIVQLTLLTVTLPFILINPTHTRHHLATLLQATPSSAQSQQFTPIKFIPATFSHLFHSLMKLPAYFSLVMILIFRYKYMKFTRFIIHELNGSAKPVSYWQVDIAYMKLFFCQQLIDMSMYLPIVILATLMRPFNIKWLSFVINQKYDVEHKMIIKYFIKCLCDLILWLPSTLVLTLLLTTYSMRKVFTIAKGYFIIYKNQSLLQSITEQSMLKKYSLTLIKLLKNDLPFLPLYFTMTLSMFQLFDPNMQPQSCYTIFQKVIKMFYIHRVKKSPRSEQYFDMFSKDLASGLLHSQGRKMRFWKFAHKCQRHILITRILQCMVPKRKYEKKLQKIEKQNSLSQISNQYWYRYYTTIKMFQIWFFFAIQVIVSLFGLLVLAPLTLWRLPTFIIVYRIHNSKRYFFKILLEVYKLMVYDIITSPLHIVGFILSPVGYLKFRKSTIFIYGSVGYTQLISIEQKKLAFITKILVAQTAKIYLLLFEVLSIVVIYMRKAPYRAQLKRLGLTFSILTKALYKGHTIPTFTQLTNPNFKLQQINKQLNLFSTVTQKYFHQSLKDLPYLLISLFILTIMPWRYHYLKKALKSMKQFQENRYQVILVLKSVFKDYLCIAINIILLISVVKTKKSLQMIRRNYRLNFFVGFLKYQYLKQLLYELKQAVNIYFSILLLLLCLFLDWQHYNQLIMRVYVFYKQAKQLQDAKRENQKMYKNTIKQNKDLQIFSKIGFFQYVSLCQYLTVKQLLILSRVNKMNYLLLQREQIWIQKWQNNFTLRYQLSIKGSSYKQKCIKAYLLQQSMNIKQVKLTFNQMSRTLFLYHMYERKNDIPQKIMQMNLLKDNNFKQKFFKNYEWSVYEGYGPQNELPQEQNEDEEFLRLTNQVRRQRVQLKPDYKFYYDYLFARPIQTISQILNSFYRVDSNRRLKQFTFLLLTVGTPMLWLYAIYSVGYAFFQINKWMGIRILLIVYIGAFSQLLYQRLIYMYRQYWISLKPFDLYYDVKNFIIKMCQFIRIKFLLLKSWFETKVYIPVKTKLINCLKIILKYAKKAITYVANKILYVSKQFVDKVAAPLYMYCVQKLIAIKNITIMIFKATKQFLAFILNLLKNLLITFYQTLKTILKNLNTLYYSILLHSRRMLMKFGLIGQLVFTIFGLVLMTLPSIVCYFIYSQRWFVMVSTVHSAVLVVLGYKHLNRIKLGQERLA